MRPLQKQIIETLKVQPKIDVQEEVKRTIQFLKEYLVKHPFLKGYVLGISGGQDSTLAGKLTQLAIDEFLLISLNKSIQKKIIAFMLFACLMEFKRTNKMQWMPLNLCKHQMY